MNSYDEEVVVKNLDGETLGECRMLVRVVTESAGKPAWRGEFRAVPGKPFDFAFNALGTTVQVECTDGASAKVSINRFSVGTPTDQCTFVGTGPAPR